MISKLDAKKLGSAEPSFFHAYLDFLADLTVTVIAPPEMSRMASHSVTLLSSPVLGVPSSAGLSVGAGVGAGVGVGSGAGRSSS